MFRNYRRVEGVLRPLRSAPCALHFLVAMPYADSIGQANQSSGAVRYLAREIDMFDCKTLTTKLEMANTAKGCPKDG